MRCFTCIRDPVHWKRRLCGPPSEAQPQHRPNQKRNSGTSRIRPARPESSPMNCTWTFYLWNGFSCVSRNGYFKIRMFYKKLRSTSAVQCPAGRRSSRQMSFTLRFPNFFATHHWRINSCFFERGRCCFVQRRQYRDVDWELSQPSVLYLLIRSFTMRYWLSPTVIRIRNCRVNGCLRCAKTAVRFSSGYLRFSLSIKFEGHSISVYRFRKILTRFCYILRVYNFSTYIKCSFLILWGWG